MSLIRKRLAVEMWLYDELQKLYEDEVRHFYENFTCMFFSRGIQNYMYLSGLLLWSNSRVKCACIGNHPWRFEWS